MMARRIRLGIIPPSRDWDIAFLENRPEPLNRRSLPRDYQNVCGSPSRDDPQTTLLVGPVSHSETWVLFWMPNLSWITR